MLKYILGGVLLIVVVSISFRWYFGTEKMFYDAVKEELKSVEKGDDEIIVVEDLESLPELLQNYLKKAGVIDKPRVKFFKVEMTGEMVMDRGKEFAPVKADQYTFLESGTRLFYISMDFKGIPINGIHYYNSEEAFMKIKVLDLIKVIDNSGQMMQKAETVTYFNDLCIMAPGGLLEENIKWEVIDDKQVMGTLSKHGHEVSAILTFNEDGMLENFISEDRIYIDSKGNSSNIPWSTPMSTFGSVGEFHLPKAGKAIWHFMEEDFTYIHLTLENVSVNTQNYPK